MSAKAFADTIIGKLSDAIGTEGTSFNEGSASTAMIAVAQGITEYLITNTTVTIAYAGVITTPPNPADPVVTDVFTIQGACAPTGPSNSFDDWISKIEANIIAGFQLSPLGAAGVAFPINPFLNPGIPISQEILKNAHNIDDDNPQSKIWEIICQAILDWGNGTAMNTAVSAATRTTGPSSGTASIIKITIT